MFILIEDNNKLIKKVLNKIEEYAYKGIKIYFNNCFYMALAKGYYFSNNSKIVKLEARRYEIGIENYYYHINVYVYLNDDGIDEFSFYENKNFIAASSKNADIYLKDRYLKDKYLTLKDGILESNLVIHVNNRLYDRHLLVDGDYVKILSFKFIYFKEFLYINNFELVNNLKPYEIKRQIIKYPSNTKLDKYYLKETYKDLNVSELKEYKPIDKKDNADIIKTIMPNIVMAIAIGVSAYFNAQNSSNHNTNVITYFVSLIAMIFTGIIIPVSFFCIENNKYKKAFNLNKQSYLDYLKEYEDKLDEDIDIFLNDNKRRYFSLENIRDDIFYLKENSEDFLKISLGKITLRKDLVYKFSDDKDINDYYLKLDKKLKHLDDFPYLYSLIDNKITTIVSSNIDKRYFFNRFLLELGYKYHFDDISIAIYTSNISLLDNYYDLPHLYLDSKRLFLMKQKELMELDLKKLEKPLILFVDKKCNYAFSNPNIHVLYFSIDRNDIYKNSDCVIEYLNNEGLVSGNINQSFYYVKEDISMSKYFNRIKDYNNLFNESKNYSFFDIFNNFDIKKSYKEIHHDLKADFAYSDNELLSFDLHEKKQGPHGLIGGTTGSGKSELIVSLLLSLCIRYSPDYLNIVLIDYKGGGIQESLTHDGKSLPHIIGSVSNLENNSIERLIIALNNECKRRQSLFKYLSNKNNVSIMNLDDYLSNDYEEKIAHLLIVVDEFAELKKENSEQIKQLISISRIGRSLGIHLILATQKPSGNIDEEIFSNSRFKLALKVFEEKDSNDLIRSNKAAYLTKPGSFYLKIDDSLIKAQAIYSKKAINNSEPYIISLLDHKLNIIKSKKINRDIVISEADYYVKKINDICLALNIKTNKLKYQPIDLVDRSKCNSKDIVLGISDDYINNKNTLLNYSLNKNILIYSNRKNEVYSILNTLNENNQKTIYIGNERLENKVISDYLNYDDEEDLLFLFNYLLTNNDKFSLVIEDINCLLSYSDEYLNYLVKLLKRSENMDFNFIFITKSCQLPYKLLNCFKDRFIIFDSDKNNVSYFFSASSKYKGNCFYYDDEVKPFVPIKIESFNSDKAQFKNIIKHIPDLIRGDLINNSYLMGYEIKSRDRIYSDFNVLITGYNEKQLKIYKASYPDMKIVKYDDLDINNFNGNILWLGSGIFRQHLFISNLRNDLNENEAYFINENNRYILRSINHV